MAGRQTFRILTVGKPGSGKSILAKKFLSRMEGRYKKLIIVNRKREMAEFCQAAFTVRETGSPGRVLRRYDRIFFQVTGYDPRPFLDELGQEIMRLENVLLVMDEAHNFWERSRVPKGLLEVKTGGREQGHSTYDISQMLVSSLGSVDPVVIKTSSHLVSFRLTDPREVDKFTELVPEFGSRVKALRRPNDGGLPEYVVKNLDTDEGGAMLRDPRNPKAYIWVPFHLVT